MSGDNKVSSGQERPCPGVARISEPDRIWWVPPGKHHTECTWCNACFVRFSQQYGKPAGYEQVTNMRECNCDSPFVGEVRLLTDKVIKQGVKVHFQHARTKRTLDIVEPGVKPAAGDHAHMVSMKSVTPYTIHVTHTPSKDDGKNAEYFAIPELLINDRKVEYDDALVYHHLTTKREGFKDGGDESFMFTAFTGQNASGETKKPADKVVLRVQLYRNETEVQRRREAEEREQRYRREAEERARNRDRELSVTGYGNPSGGLAMGAPSAVFNDRFGYGGSGSSGTSFSFGGGGGSSSGTSFSFDGGGQSSGTSTRFSGGDRDGGRSGGGFGSTAASAASGARWRRTTPTFAAQHRAAASPAGWAGAGAGADVPLKKYEEELWRPRTMSIGGDDDDDDDSCSGAGAAKRIAQMTSGSGPTAGTTVSGGSSVAASTAYVTHDRYVKVGAEIVFEFKLVTFDPEAENKRRNEAWERVKHVRAMVKELQKVEKELGIFDRESTKKLLLPDGDA